MSVDSIPTFRAITEAAGLRPGEILADGALHRCPTAEKPNSRNGWYIFHADAPAGGAFGDWAQELSQKWTAKEERDMTTAERQTLHAHVEQDKAMHEAEEVRRHVEATEKARRILAEATPCIAHPYLARKGVKPCPGLKVGSDGLLLVPVLSPDDGQAMSLQLVLADGGKRFLTGGRVQGGFFPIKGNPGRLFVCEGLATGLSVHEATGQTVLCAFSCGNLQPVASYARQKYPAREIVLASDNDAGTENNPGLRAATEATSIVGGLLAVPQFAPGEAGTDWNDLHALHGLEAVCEGLGKAAPATEVKGSQSPSLRVVSVADMLTMELPERRHLLTPILPEQGLIMLYAPRGLGKTWAALSMAYAVASGQAVFGWNAPTPRKVLYLDGEMPCRAMQERLASIVAGFSEEPPNAEYLRILTPDLQPDYMPNLATPEGQAAIAPHLEGVELVVVDNLATLAHHGRENEAESWLPVQEWLLRLRRSGKSVLLVHHAGKGGGQRGTSAREDILDTVIAMRRPSDYEPQEGARFEVHLEKARGICGPDAAPFEAILHIDAGRASWATRPIEDAEYDRVSSLQAQGLSIRDIAEETGLSKSKVGRLLKNHSMGAAA